MFFICADSKVIRPDVLMTNAYQYRDQANGLIKNTDRAHFMWEDKTMPVPVRKVEGFYLVHESLYDEILKAHDKEAKD